MSAPRFLADHNLDDDIVNGVFRREPAIDFIRAREVGVDRLPDDELLAFAAERGLVIVSHDVNTLRHFAYERIIAGQVMTGLLLVHRLGPIRPVIDSLVLIWSATQAEEWNNEVQFLPI